MRAEGFWTPFLGRPNIRRAAQSASGLALIATAFRTASSIAPNAIAYAS